MAPKVTNVSGNVAGSSLKGVQSQKTGSINSVWTGNTKTVTGKIKDKNGNLVEKQFIVVQTGLKNGRSLVMDERGNQYTMAHDGIILKQEYVENPEKFKADSKNKKVKQPQYKVSKDKADNIAFLDNQLATAQKALKEQEDKDGWAGDVANAFGYINVFKKDKNTYSAVREDLSIAENNNKKLKAAAKISDAEFEKVFEKIYETPYKREAIEAYRKNPTKENWEKAFGKKQLDPSRRANEHIESQKDGAGTVKTTAKVGIGIGTTVLTGGNLAAGAAATALASELIDESDNLKVTDLAKGEVNFRNDNHGEIARDAVIAGVAYYGVGKGIQLGAKAAQATGLDKAAANFTGKVVEKGKILLGQYGDDAATTASTTTQNTAQTAAQKTVVINGKVYQVKPRVKSSTTPKTNATSNGNPTPKTQSTSNQIRTTVINGKTYKIKPKSTQSSAAKTRTTDSNETPKATRPVANGSSNQSPVTDNQTVRASSSSQTRPKVEQTQINSGTQQTLRDVTLETEKPYYPAGKGAYYTEKTSVKPNMPQQLGGNKSVRVEREVPTGHGSEIRNTTVTRYSNLPGNSNDLLVGDHVVLKPGSQYRIGNTIVKNEGGKASFIESKPESTVFQSSLNSAKRTRFKYKDLEYNRFVDSGSGYSFRLNTGESISIIDKNGNTLGWLDQGKKMLLEDGTEIFYKGNTFIDIITP